MTYGPPAIEAVGIQVGWTRSRHCPPPGWHHATDASVGRLKQIIIGTEHHTLKCGTEHCILHALVQFKLYTYCTHIHEVLPSQCTYRVSIMCTIYCIELCTLQHTVTSDGQLFTPTNPHPPAKMDYQAFILTRAYWHMHPCLAVTELNISLQCHAYRLCVLHCTPMLHSPDIQQITEHLRKLLHGEIQQFTMKIVHTHVRTFILSTIKYCML